MSKLLEPSAQGWQLDPSVGTRASSQSYMKTKCWPTMLFPTLSSTWRKVVISKQGLVVPGRPRSSAVGWAPLCPIRRKREAWRRSGDVADEWCRDRRWRSRRCRAAGIRWSRLKGDKSGWSRSQPGLLCISPFLPVFLQLVFQPLISAQTGSSIEAWQPGGLNYWWLI